MPLLKRTTSTFVGKAASPDQNEVRLETLSTYERDSIAHQHGTHPLSFDEARDLVHTHLVAAGLHSAQGLHDDGSGGAHIGSTQVYYDYDFVHHSLTCCALIYHFRHRPPPNVVQAFRDIAAELDTGGGDLRYEPDNSGLYLTRTFLDCPSRGQFKKDMEHLLRAAQEWSDVGPERAATLVQDPRHTNAGTAVLPADARAPVVAPVAAPPTTTIPPVSVGKQTAARRAHQRSEAVTPPLQVPEHDRSNQQETVGGVRSFTSTPISAGPMGIVVSAPQARSGTSGQLHHPSPIQASRSGRSPTGSPLAPSRSSEERPASPSTVGRQSSKLESTPSHETLFHKLMHKLPHRVASPRAEGDEPKAPSHPHPLVKLDPNEPRPSGMPLRIYSSSSTSRAMWEQPETKPVSPQPEPSHH